MSSTGGMDGRETRSGPPSSTSRAWGFAGRGPLGCWPASRAELLQLKGHETTRPVGQVDEAASGGSPRCEDDVQVRENIGRVGVDGDGSALLEDRALDASRQDADARQAQRRGRL